MPRSIWLTLLLFGGGCASKPPPVRIASPELKSADGRHTAHVEVHFIPGFESLHASRSDEVNHVLVIDGQSVIVERFPTAGNRVNVPTATRANFTLRFADDGHAVSINDGSSAWNHVVLDARRPFRCNGVGNAVAPPTRELVRQSLSALNVDTEKRTCDLDGLTEVLCDSKLDEALWLEALPHVLESSLVDVERHPLLDCVRGAMAMPAVRARVLSGLTDPRQLEMAAEVLLSRPEEEVELALVKALQSLDGEPESTSRCEKSAKVSWALASSVVARKSAAASTRALLQKDLESAPACPRELTGKARRVYAVMALSALGDSAVAKLAASCAAPPPHRALVFKQWNEAMLENLVQFEPSCLARGFAP